jgi:hypothetical protein
MWNKFQLASRLRRNPDAGERFLGAEKGGATNEEEMWNPILRPCYACPSHRAGRILDRAGRNHHALLYRGREADVAIEHCRIIVQKPSGGRKLDEDDGIVQLALKIVASVILRLETFKFGGVDPVDCDCHSLLLHLQARANRSNRSDGHQYKFTPRRQIAKDKDGRVPQPDCTIPALSAGGMGPCERIALC